MTEYLTETRGFPEKRNFTFFCLYKWAELQIKFSCYSLIYYISESIVWNWHHVVIVCAAW